jgi:hypothetical protein
MGLDMYLSAKKYESNYKFEIERNGENETFNTILQAIGAEGKVSPDSPHLEVSVNIGYWRKANAVHAWFVNELADGRDECQPIYVPREKLIELRNICETIIKHKDNPAIAQEQLPTQAGFFFGGVEYDEWYYREIQDTIDQINNALNFDERWSFEYQASW